MKHSFFEQSVLLSSIFLLGSCFNAIPGEESLPASSHMQKVTFSFDTFEQSQQPLETRATFSAPTVLLLMDELNGAVVQTKQLTSSSTLAANGYEVVGDVLNDLSLDMTYGQHTVYVVAAAKAYDSFDDEAMTVSWSNATASLGYTWAKKLTVTVSQNALPSQQVNLPLAIGRVELICNDVQDPSIAKMQIRGASICWTLDLTTMKGNTTEDGITITLPYTSSNYNAGKGFGFFSFEPAASTGSDPNIGSVTYSAQKQDGSVITSHTLTNVPLRAGYLTQYKGSFYTNSAGFSLSVADDWTGSIAREY